MAFEHDFASDSSGNEGFGLLSRELHARAPVPAEDLGPRRAYRFGLLCAALLAAAAVVSWTPIARQSAGGDKPAAAPPGEVQGLFGFSFFSHCSKKTCEECVSEDGCRWCPKTGDCHDETSLEDRCEIPINSKGQCWGAKCAYQLGEFMNHRADDAKQWIEQTAEWQVKPLLPFPTYPAGSTGMFDMATGQMLLAASGGSALTSRYVISAIADWGTGTCAAQVVADIAKGDDPDMTIHMGDVYFVATPDQFNTNILGHPRNGLLGTPFPRGKSVTFLQMGNHELISGCEGLYVNGFSYTGQKATYAAWQSDKWRIISLDTGRLCYPTNGNGMRNAMGAETDAPMPDEVVDWLTNTVKLGDPNDKRGILLLGHHQPYDAFATSYMGTANQLNKILPKGKQVLWLFGHNHMLALYKKMQLPNTDFVVYPRLIGIGGFPNILAGPKVVDGLVAYDSRTYQSIPDDDGLNQNIGFNGYAKIEIDGDKMDVSYITASCTNGDCEQGLTTSDPTTVAFETFQVDSAGNVDQTWMYVSSELTKVSEPKDEVASVSCIPAEALVDVNPVLNHFDR